MISIDDVIAVYREHGLDEPFVFPHYECGVLAGMITGFYRIIDGQKVLDVDHMIVRPGARRKFHTMMVMSHNAIQTAFTVGCEFVLVSMFQNDPRRSGLDAWAKRMDFEQYASSDGVDWFRRRRPAERNPRGQESTEDPEASGAAAAPAAARSKRGRPGEASSR